VASGRKTVRLGFDFGDETSFGLTLLGLTADGTIWTWGIDPSREPVLDFSAKLELLQDRVKFFFRRSSAGTTTTSGYARPPYQKQPRPLMRLVSYQSQPPNTGR